MTQTNNNKTQPNSGPPPKHGIIYNVLWGWPWALIGIVLSSLLLSLLFEYIGIAFFWIADGATHSQQVMLTESGWLSSEFTRSLLFSEPSVTVTGWVNYAWQRCVIDSGLMQWLNTQYQTQMSTHSELSQEINNWTAWLGRYLHEYLLATVYVTGITLIRVTILLLSVPLFVMVVVVAIVEGLGRRDLRRYGAAYESSFVYHHARRLVKPALCVPCMLYLSWPTAIYPNLLLLPAALLLGTAVTVTMATFKKYL